MEPVVQSVETLSKDQLKAAKKQTPEEIKSEDEAKKKQQELQVSTFLYINHSISVKESSSNP